MTVARARRLTPLVVTHGGVGAPGSHADCCEVAARAAMVRLRRGAILDAVIDGAVILEDDPRFNADSGSYLRLDGRTIEMDAAVMDPRGTVGAVAATGQGEEIIRRLLCRVVYEDIARGETPQKACEKGVRSVPRTFAVGLIAIGLGGAGAAHNRDMPFVILEG